MTFRQSPVRPVRVPSYPLMIVLFIVIEATGVFEQAMIYVAIPHLMTSFGLDAAGISWSVTVFLLVGAGTVALAGRFGDLYGRKRVLIVLMVVSAAGSLISVVLGTYEGILLGRALQGTSAAIFPLLVGIAREVAPAPRVPVLISFASGTAALAGALAGLVAGVLIDAGDWRLMFVASGGLAVGALVFAALALPAPVVEPVAHRHRIDYWGAILMAPGVAAVLFGFTLARSGLSPVAVACIVVGLIVVLVWIVLQLRLAHPMFNLRLFANPSLALALGVTGFLGLGVFSAFALLVPILQQSPPEMPVGLGLTPTVAGAVGLAGGVIGFALSPLAGRVAARSGAKSTLVIAVALCFAGIGLLGFSGHSFALALVAMIVTGLGTSFVFAGVPALIVEIVPPSNTGEAVGIVYGAGRTLFTAIGTAVAGLLLTTDLVPGTTAPTIGTWWLVIAYTLICTLLAAVCVFFIRRGTPMSARGDEVEAAAEMLQPSAPAAEQDESRAGGGAEATEPRSRIGR